MKTILLLLVLTLLPLCVCAVNTDWGKLSDMDYDQVCARTFVVPQVKRISGAVDPNGIPGKVMCGYQGWFAAEGDGYGRGWYHYQGGRGFTPESLTIDMWPDTSEYKELYPTAFKNPDGTTAGIFSSLDLSTTRLHFSWMRQYSIDGVYLQRFVGEVAGRDGLYHNNIVLHNARIAANEYGRVISITYDFSGQGRELVDNVKKDWMRLVDDARITKDPAFLRHNGKPVLELWGVGFNDNRRYTIEDCIELVDWLHNDPKYGGCYVVIGVPDGWREQNRDCIKSDAMTEVLDKADCISPWAVGRFGSIREFSDWALAKARADYEWCVKRGKIFMPVVFPGFTWHNMNPDSPLNSIPRMKGKFLQAQYRGHASYGAVCAYQAMFDEIDEGTAIFKVTNKPPTGNGAVFADLEGMPSDTYLKIVREGKRLIQRNVKK
ncbi:MAG: xylosidase/arabinosidase [Abditibacteriota bacterium]|nr:xylosidase/arabinosidase [Abditibacteriota bacterium]